MTATTRRLISYLSRPLRADPDAVDALTIQYVSGTVAIRVDNGRLTTTVPGTPSANIDLLLADYTLSSLASAINSRFGYAASVIAGADGARGALTLLDATVGSGGVLTAYRSLIWAYMHAIAVQLDLARAAIADMLMQLRITAATGEWLDLWRELLIGGQRAIGETDAQQRTRIVTTVSRIKSTNIAIERVVFERTGVNVLIRDLPWYFADQTLFTVGGPLWNSAQVTNSAAARTPPAALVDASLLANFGLTALPDGRPAAPASPGQALICPIAVIFPDGAGCGDYCSVMKVVEEFRAGGTFPLSFKSAASASPGDPDVGLLYRRWRCSCPRGDITDFFDFDRTLLTPSDTTLLNPVPYGGLYFPFGGQVAVEDRFGRSVVLRFVSDTWFFGLTVVRVLATGSDVGLVVYGLTMDALTSLRPDSGDRIVDVALSDTESFDPAAVGGVYVVVGGVISYLGFDNVSRSAPIASDTWVPSGILRVNSTSTSSELVAVAFVRGEP